MNEQLIIGYRLKICILSPDGYHLPTDDEWKQLEQNLGMSSSDANENGYRGNIGNKLKSTSGWSSNRNGTNSSGFNVFAGGYRFTGGSFNYAGYSGYWWSATPSSSSNAWGRLLFYDYAKVERFYYDRVWAFLFVASRTER